MTDPAGHATESLPVAAPCSLSFHSIRDSAMSGSLFLHAVRVVLNDHRPRQSRVRGFHSVRINLNTLLVFRVPQCGRSTSNGRAVAFRFAAYNSYL